MSGRTVYRVRPSADAWVIELPADSLREVRAHRTEAIARAKELARRAPAAGVVVVDREGNVEEEIVIDPDGGTSRH